MAINEPNPAKGWRLFLGWCGVLAVVVLLALAVTYGFELIQTRLLEIVKS